VETVRRRQELVAIAKVVLAELGGGVAQRFQDFGECRILLLDATGRSGNSDRRHAGANRQLAHDESSAAGRATWLAVVVGEQYALFRDAIDVRCSAHEPE